MEKLQLVIAQRSAALHSAAEPSAAYVWTSPKGNTPNLGDVMVGIF